MNKRIGGITITCVALALACGTSSAQDLGKLGGMLPGGSSMTSGSMGNVAGLLEYCVKNNYLGGDSGASGVKDQLLGKMGGGSSSASPMPSSGGQSESTSDMLGQLTGSKSKKSDSNSTSSTSTSGGAATSDPSYLSGAKGILQGSDGKSMDLSSVGGGSSDMKSQMTTKVCSTVLKQGKSFLSK